MPIASATSPSVMSSPPANVESRTRLFVNSYARSVAVIFNGEVAIGTGRMLQRYNLDATGAARSEGARRLQGRVGGERPMSVEGLLGTLGGVYPPTRLFADAARVAPYESDALTSFRCRPEAVVLPETREEVVETVRACHREQVPFVARGSGTS